jgi:EmrB/QacA subfamily drug resistance transporter
MFITTVAAFLTPFDVSAVNIALPTISQDLSMNAIQLSWVSTAYLLASAVFLVPFGRIADISGRKKIFTYGIGLFTLASLAVSFSTSSQMLIFLRVIQGIGGAMTTATLVAILASTFPSGERGKVLGINSAAIYVGLTVGPFLGGLITQYVGWRSIFLINVPLGIITVLLIIWRLKAEWHEAEGERFDATGSVIYGLALISIIYGVTILPTTLGLIFTIGGGVGLLAFIWYEGRRQSPVLDLRLFRNNRIFVFSNMAALINYMSVAAVGFLLSLFLQYIDGLTPQIAGLILLCQPIVQATLSPIAGRLSDRLEPRIISSAGMVVTAASLFLLSLIGPGTSSLMIVANLALLGVGLALFVSPNTNAIMGSVAQKSLGVASGTLGTMRQVGQTLGMGITIMTFALIIGGIQITPDLYNAFLLSIRLLFGAFAVLSFFGIFLSLARGRMRGPSSNSDIEGKNR